MVRVCDEEKKQKQVIRRMNIEGRWMTKKKKKRLLDTIE